MSISRLSTLLLVIPFLPACIVYADPAPEAGSTASTGGAVTAPESGSAVQADAAVCDAVLAEHLESTLTRPDEYRDNPNVDGDMAVLGVSIVGEVAASSPRWRARFMELLDHPNEKIRRQVLTFMANEQPEAWRDVFLAQIDAPSSRARTAALSALVGDTDPTMLARVRAAAQRQVDAGELPWVEGRILAAANDSQALPILNAAMAHCPRREPSSRGGSLPRDRFSQCAEIIVYRYGLGGPERDARRVLRGDATRQSRAIRALGLIDRDLARPYLREVLSGTELNQSVLIAGYSVERLGLTDDAVILGHMQRWSRHPNNYAHTFPNQLPAGDPVAVERLLALAEADPPGAAGFAAHLIERGSPEGARFVLEAGRGGENSDSFLAARQPMAYHLRSIPGAEADRLLTMLADEADYQTRLAAALVLAQRGQAHSVVSLVLGRGPAAGHDSHEMMFAAAACIITSGG